MSDLRPKGIEMEIGGQKRYLLFTINAIDEIQEKCNAPLLDAMEYVANAASGETDHDTLQNFRTIVTVLLNDEGDGNLTEKEVGRMLTINNLASIAVNVLRAYGVSIPEPDDSDADEEEEDPNLKTGQ